MSRKGYIGLFLSVMILSTYQQAQAAKKAPKKIAGKIVEANSLTSTTVQIPKGKKKVSKTIYCLGSIAGTVANKKTGLSFLSYSDLIKNLGLETQTAKIKTKLSEAKAIKKAGKTACAATITNPNTNPNSTPVPGQIPDHLSLTPYSGAFTTREANILYDRFAFGGKADEITSAVSSGLASTIARLTNYVYDPVLETRVGDLSCDAELEVEGDNDNTPCLANGINFNGTRYGLYYRILNSQSPYFEKMAFWLHDERMSAAGLNTLNTQTYGYTIIRHINLLRNAAISGDYKEFINEMNYDDLGHRLSLDGGSNNGFSPNENYGREILELATVGPTGLDGKAVYDDQDIAQNALAFSGVWNAFHAVGPKVLFHGTPWEATVYDMETATAAMFNHPRTAEHLAEDIWKEFINPFATPDAIRALAAIIREKNYNLNETMKVVMASKAIFAAASQETLIKHPLEVVMSVMRSTGLRASYQRIDAALARMSQRPLLPPTVFGWDEKKLAGEAMVFDWRNAIGDVVSDTNIQARSGLTIGDLIAGPSDTSPRSIRTVHNILGRLNIPATDAVINPLVRYLDNNISNCGATNPANRVCFGPGNGYYLTNSPLSNVEGSSGPTKVRNAIIIAATLPDFRTK